MPAPVKLDGRSLAIEDVVAVARRGVPVTIAPRALDAVRESRRTVEDAIARGATMYGVTTGFGKLAHVRIPPERARQLQLNLIRSHASGVGDPLSEEAVRAMMLLRANVLVRGTSGVRPALPELIVAMLNKRVHPRVPSQGSVGASGDLAPLAHLALAMIGEGEDGGAVQARGLQPIALEAKEGLAFVNGTQAQTGVAALVIHDAWVLWRTAHAAAAMSLEATRGTPEPFDPRIHEARPHRFQQRSAALLRELLADSPGMESGFMTPQIAAAALVADCRILATPASVQSVPTEGNQEDVVPMGMSAAWKAERILANATRIVAIELLAAAQGLEYLKPLRPGRGVAESYAAVRGAAPPLHGDRPLTADIERVAAGIRAGQFDPEAT